MPTRSSCLPLAMALLVLAPVVAPLSARSELRGAPDEQPIDQVIDAESPAVSGVEALGIVESQASTAMEAMLLQEDAYIMGPGDGIALEFLAEPELNRTVRILMDGTATLPLLGNVRLKGLTLSQANGWLEKLYEDKLLRPELILTVSEPRPLRVSVVGEVARPGLYTLNITGDTTKTEEATPFSGLPSLVDAIQKAGGVAADADLRNVVLQRRVPGRDDRFKRARFNLWALVRDGDQTQNPLLFDGDTVRLLQAAELPATQDVEISSTTLSPTSINVYVLGEVLSPGATSLPANTPLVQAVLAAGGPVNWRANRKDVQLVRLNRNGTVTQERFQLNYGERASNLNNPPLRDGDTLLVGRNLLAKTSDALDGISSPITSLVNIFALYKIISDN